MIVNDKTRSCGVGISRVSKFLSLVLVHKPEEIDLQLDEHGWARVDNLLRKLKEANRKLSRDELFQLIDNNNNKRFTLSDDGQRIRAAQRHSIDVDLGLDTQRPPDELYHGTASTSLDAIFSDELNPGRRKQVHLSLDPDTAERVGQRHGKPIVLRVEEPRMFEDGFEFFRADNGVWLTNKVPAVYLGFGRAAEK